ncbi:MAG: hypothetical protein IAG13_02715 [Deltaproteobacteria bacterium]|nr:hypothetical protein [Nannocystaceae bacterium]
MARAHAAESFAADQGPQARRDQIARGIAGNAMSIAGAVTGGVAVVTGAVLLGLGVKKRRNANAAVVPHASRRGGGLWLTVRFAP